ncbi:MAG: hypothetical protein AAB131_11270 [Actinomycetota bacterium]
MRAEPLGEPAIEHRGELLEAILDPRSVGQHPVAECPGTGADVDDVRCAELVGVAGDELEPDAVPEGLL